MPCGRKLLLAAMLLPAALAARAEAHNLVVYATADGSTVTGRAYFVGGGGAREAKVAVLAPDGSGLAETVTDAEGNFRFEATRRVDHEILVRAGAGHQGAYTVPASELPGDLPAFRGGATQAAPASRPAAAPDPHDVRALARQVSQLRRELDAHHRRARLHDILGGIGYILGVTGVAFFLLGRRRERSGR